MKLSSIACAALMCALAVSWARQAAAQGTSPSQQANTIRVTANLTKKRTPEQTANKPFVFRGIPLGITLDEFRAVSRARATPPGSVPICENDSNAGSIGMRLKTLQSLTISCQWAHLAGDDWKLSRAVVDGVPADEHVLRFMRIDGQRTFCLYEMSFVINDITADDLRNAFEYRYGAPRRATKVSSPVYIWENDVSSITLRVLPATHSATLTYLLKDPDAYIRAVVQRWQASRPDPL
ncbi:hypothetical protein PTKU46_85840 [Paraburkholderia terrae]|uniref:hypothetical protein n=1 Tax=Paraburkholderia terrae TaxID=311230 RepID=UPI0030E54394